VILDGFVPRIIRLAVRHVPPRRRGIRVAHAWTRVQPPDERIFLSRERSGLRLRCDLRDELSRVIYYRGWVDRATEDWMRRWLRPGDTYVDVGAHIGFYVSIALESLRSMGRVIAFEPAPENFEKLHQSVDEVAAVHPNLELHRAAVGAFRDVTLIYQPAGDWRHQSSRASLVPDPAGRLEPADPVKVMTLDEVLTSSACRLLKVDVEGAELAVIRGADRLLSEQRAEAVLIELNPGALGRADTSPEEVVDALAQRGYAGRSIDPDGERLIPLRAPDKRAEFVNAVFVPV
jgi:FkbM family methyltransferase